MTTGAKVIGRVTRCSTRGFVGAVRLPEPEVPAFGTFCRVEAQHGHAHVVGLIYDISIEDDEFARQLAVADSPSPEEVADHQENRLLVEYSALAVGYQTEGRFHYSLPPQPPLTLASIEATSEEEVRAFTERLDFLPLILSAQQVPVDDLVVAALRTAAAVRPPSQRRAYLVEAGRALSRLLSRDLARLEMVLRGLEA